MTATTPQRTSMTLTDVFESKDKIGADTMKDSDATGDESDYLSSLGASSHNTSHSSTSSGIMRVATLEESLSHMDIDRSCNGGRDDIYNTSKNNQESTSSEATYDDSAADSMTADESSKSQKSVTFSDVSIREYPICLGDNPAVQKGAPLSIAWEYHPLGTLSLDDYENAHPERREKEQLLLPSFVRENMLKSSGYSRYDIQKGVKDVNIARNRRKRTSETKQLHKAQEVAERLVRGALNATVRRNKKKQEKELVEHFRSEAEKLKKQYKATRRSTWVATPAAPSATLELGPEQARSKSERILKSTDVAKVDEAAKPSFKSFEAPC